MPELSGTLLWIYSSIRDKRTLYTDMGHRCLIFRLSVCMYFSLNRLKIVNSPDNDSKRNWFYSYYNLNV